MHRLCSDTVPKYRVENRAEERGTVRAINIHSPSTEDWEKHINYKTKLYYKNELCFKWHHPCWFCLRCYIWIFQMVQRMFLCLFDTDLHYKRYSESYYDG